MIFFAVDRVRIHYRLVNVVNQLIEDVFGDSYIAILVNRLVIFKF